MLFRVISEVVTWWLVNQQEKVLVDYNLCEEYPLRRVKSLVKLYETSDDRIKTQVIKRFTTK